MKTKLIATSVFTLGLFAHGISADTPKKSTATDSSTVVFENDKVRTILYQTGTGKNVCGFGMHSHPAHLYIQLGAAKFRVTTPDGKVKIVDAKAGEVGWEAAATHRVESVSGESVTTYLVELKDKDWKPSTGLSL